MAAIRRADSDFSLIDKGDRIAIGLSGGKDSLSLLYALSLYGKFAGKSFKLFPIYLDLGFGNVDVEALKKFCSDLGLKLIIDDSTFVYDVLKAHQEPGKHLPCSICSRMKKAAMNAQAKRLRCNKVAFAHHKDDAVETLFMNMLHGGRVATFAPKMELKRSGLTFIRPLIYCAEKQTTDLAKEMEFPVIKSPCPADGYTDRQKVKETLLDLYKRYPGSEKNFMSMLGNYESFCLYFDDYELGEEDPSEYSLKPLVTAEGIRGTSFAARKSYEGETDYQVLHKHKPVAEIAVQRVLAHRYRFFDLSGDEEALYRGLSNLIARLSKKIIPLLVIMEGGHAKLAKRLGFVYGYEPSVQKKCWHLKTGL